MDAVTTPPIIQMIEQRVLHSQLGPRLKAWRAAYQEREYSRALIRRRQSAVVADVVYRLVMGRPANRHEQAEMRRRAIDGTSLMHMVQELRWTDDGSCMAIDFNNPALRAFLRRQFDPDTGESFSPRVVFLHIQKAGGTSISDMLANWFGWERSRVSLWLDHLALCSPQVLANSKVIAGHFPFAALQLIPPPLETLVVLRDPFDRTLSHYDNLRRANPVFHDLTLEQFVFQERCAAMSGNFQVRYLARDIDLANAWRSWSPEHRLASLGGDPAVAHPLQTVFEWPYIEYSEEQWLQDAKRNLDKIDLVGITEALGDFAAQVAARFGLPPAQVQRLNPSPTPFDIRDLSTRVRRRIDECTAADRELYDYAKQRALS